MKLKAGLLRCFAYSCWTIWVIEALFLALDKSGRFLDRNWITATIVSIAAIPAGLIAYGFSKKAEESISSGAHPEKP